MKQIQAVLQVFAGTALFVHGKNIIFGAGEKVVVTKECVTEGKQPEILDAGQVDCRAGRICKVKPKQIKQKRAVPAKFAGVARF
ncbi:MAG: hypothetical protein ACLS6W_06515 [Ruminococcus sp.]